jgi:hypothetical protein
MGYAFDETMSGTMTLAGSSEEVPFTFSVHVRSKRGKATMEGVVEAPGLAVHAPCEGTMVLSPFRQRVVKYDLSWKGDDGKRYRFTGQKDIRWMDALRTWTTLPGEIRDETGALVATCSTRFDYRADWMQFLTSWKPA